MTGWTLTDAARQLWSAPLSFVTRQLYVNGRRATRAVGTVPVSLTRNSTGYRASAATMAGWRNPSDIEFVYTGGNALWSHGVAGVGPWTEARCPVASISGTTITMAQPCWDNSTKRVNNLVFGSASRVHLDNDEFVHLGGAGVDFGDGTQGSTVRGSVFSDISGNAMMVGGVDQVSPSAAQATTGNAVTDNRFFDLPAEFHGGVGVFVGYADHTTVAHNQIDHTSYSAVSLGWGGWRQKEQKPAQVNPAHDNVVGANLIFDHMLLLADGGAIYTNGVVGTSLAHGETLSGNVMHDQFGSGKTLYTDNGASYVTMTGNVLADNDYRDWGTKQTNYALNANGPMDVEGNWWQMGDMDTGAANVTVTGNHVIGTLADAPSSIVDSAGLEPAFRGLLSRRYGTGAPDAPSQVAVSAGNGFAYVSWAPPVDEGGAPVTAYVVRSASGHTVTVSASQFRTTGYATVSGLANGTADTFTVSARNANGTGAASLPSRVVTPNAAAVSVPTPPRSLSAVTGDGRVTIRFGLPSSNGGSPITSYTVTGGGRTVRVTGRTVLVLTGGSHFHYGVIAGLAPGTTYTFTVTADNVAGSSAPATVTAAL